MRPRLTLIALTALLGLLPFATAWQPGPDVADKISQDAEPVEAVAYRIQVGGRELDGRRITCDLPDSQHLRNVGGSDGAGLCVFCSTEHDARWQNVPVLTGFRDWMRKYPGGGYPSKLDKMIAQKCREAGVPVPPYLQHTGGDVAFLESVLKTNRYVAVTYAGKDGVYYRDVIAHMVNLVHLDSRWAVVHDNNYPGKYLWLPRAEFVARWKANSGGWAVALLAPPPPPIPVN